jgi:hypothetical protein
MSDSPENPVLAPLRAIRGDISDVQGSLTEIKRCLTNLESGQLPFMPQSGVTDSCVA